MINHCCIWLIIKIGLVCRREKEICALIVFIYLNSVLDLLSIYRVFYLNRSNTISKNYIIIFMNYVKYIRNMQNNIIILGSNRSRLFKIIKIFNYLLSSVYLYQIYIFFSNFYFSNYFFFVKFLSISYSLFF